MADKEAATAVAKPVSAPAATVAAKKTGLKSTKPKAMHPSTADMIVAAITALKERGGSSLQAIKKYIAGTYMLDAERLAPYIRKHIKAAVASGALVQTKGKGASGSFKLPSGKSDVAKTKKTATKAAVTKKAASPKKPGTAKKPATGKKPESATKTAKKPVAAKKAAPKKPATAEKTKKAPAAKSAATKAAKSPSKVKKVSKAPTTKPKAPKPKKIAAPKNTPKKAAAKK